MARSTKEISQLLSGIPSHLTGADWGFAFLKCYQGKDSKLPSSTFDRVKSGGSNAAQDKVNEILWKKRIYYRWVDTDIRSAFSEALKDKSLFSHKTKPMFFLFANSEELIAYDVDLGENQIFRKDELPSYAHFFLPFVGKKKVSVSSEALEVDVKATRKMSVLFDEIRKDNLNFSNHDLNVFLARILFCFYAEDTGIFEKNQFTNFIASQSASDGSDVAYYIAEAFRRFRTQDDSQFSGEFKDFKYVNGGLFEREHSIPQFSEKSRKLLIENGSMAWQSINPDIFGSMFQSIIDPEKRHELGMHYTSRENIMKVVSPLFLDELKAELEQVKSSQKKLNLFHQRLTEIKIFDPACGSGNFLILAYEKLRELEMEIYQALSNISHNQDLPMPRINVNQFYGIEIDDFAHELAMLALWIKEHQMNLIFHERFNASPEALPLREGANITLGNACRLDWGDTCPRMNGEKQNEIYVLGNPPYLGAKWQEPNQKEDLEIIVKSYNPTRYRNLDYIACWFIKGAEYIADSLVKVAFVSTNSICQGEHSALLWHPLLEINNMEIQFAYKSFKWTNEGIGNAGVTCIVVGISKPNQKDKRLFDENTEKCVSQINNYLLPSENCWLWRINDSISYFPKIAFGSMPRDGGYLILSHEEREVLLNEDPKIDKFIKAYVGADEFLKKRPRYCLWIDDQDLEEATAFSFIKDRLKRVASDRSKSRATSTCNAQETPHRFVQRAHQNTESIIFPSVTSEKREYIPLGFLDENTVISNLAYAIYDATPWIFGVLSSKMHMEWTKLVAGRLETRVRYSSFVYNNFPIPPLSNAVKEKIEEAVFEIIDIREEFSELTYAEMYTPEKMPEKLLAAHRALDAIIDKCYRSKPFKTLNERLEHLIALYKEMSSSAD